MAEEKRPRLLAQRFKDILGIVDAVLGGRRIDGPHTVESHRPVREGAVHASA
jgi:hypothetical protein